MLNRRTLLAAALLPAAHLPAGIAQARPAAVADSPGLLEAVAADAVPVPVYQDGLWCEGPVWAPAFGGLVFSDVKRSQVLLLRPGGDAVAVRDPSGNTNGNGLDAQGRLLGCEHLGRRLVRRERDGGITVLADRHRGKRLNSPNDLAVAPDGAVWFTDPTYGLTQPEEGRRAEPEQPGRYVFRWDPSGRLDVVDDGFEQPNGIVFSPDFRRLYVSETAAATNPEAASEIRVFDVDGARLRNPRVFAVQRDGVPDGLEMDTAGRVYAATAEGVRVWAPDGTRLGRIAVPATAGNLAFGGADGGTLFICNGSSIHAVGTKAQGAHWIG